MNFKEFINDFTAKAEEFIAKYEEVKTLKGEVKKKRVDELLLTWAISSITSLQVNPILKFALKWILSHYLPVFTQNIFNLIETRIAGITK